ncbi:MAG: sigma 54-interacting transcriptional regulator, partial [Methylococcales bacterium]
LQPKLLRALESGQYRRVGGTVTLKANVRVICATHRNLAEMVQQGAFREDLYYRLSVFPVNIPPLRERMQDIPALTHHLLEQAGGVDSRRYSLTKAALIKLMQHQWPGNIRELRNCLQLAAGLCADNSIDEDNINILQIQVQIEEPVLLETEMPIPVQIGASKNKNPIEKMESEIIMNLIKKYQGNRKRIAEEMNISERTLYRKLKRLNLGNLETALKTQF